MTSVAVHADQLFSPVPGGIGTYVRELLPAMHALDPSLDITLFRTGRDGPRPSEPWLRAFRMEEIPGNLRLLYPGWNLTGRPALPPSLRVQDMLHAPSSVAVPPLAPNQRLVVTIHDLAFRVYPSLYPAAWRALFRAGTRRAGRRADAVIAVSEHTAKDIARFTRTDPARIHVVPLAAALPPSSEEPERVLARLRVRGPYVLFVGTLEPRKNLVRLVRAYRRAVGAAGLPHTLVLAGPMGWKTNRLQAEVKAEGPGQIVLTGATRPEDLDVLYRRASALVYPSLYEGFGLPVLEAMARGVPTIVSRVSSLPEVAGDAAVFVDPRSARELADAMERLLTNKEVAEALAAAGRARAAQFSWERTARLTLAVYRRVLEG